MGSPRLTRGSVPYPPQFSPLVNHTSSEVSQELHLLGLFRAVALLNPASPTFTELERASLREEAGGSHSLAQWCTRGAKEPRFSPSLLVHRDRGL